MQINISVSAKGFLLHLWSWFLAGFAATLGFALARGLLLWIGWWR